MPRVAFIIRLLLFVLIALVEATLSVAQDLLNVTIRQSTCFTSRLNGLSPCCRSAVIQFSSRTPTCLLLLVPPMVAGWKLQATGVDPVSNDHGTEVPTKDALTLGGALAALVPLAQRFASSMVRGPRANKLLACVPWFLSLSAWVAGLAGGSDLGGGSLRLVLLVLSCHSQR